MMYELECNGVTLVTNSWIRYKVNELILDLYRLPYSASLKP